MMVLQVILRRAITSSVKILIWIELLKTLQLQNEFAHTVAHAGDNTHIIRSQFCYLTRSRLWLCKTRDLGILDYARAKNKASF